MAYEIRFSDEAVIQLQKICIYLNDNWSEKITEEFLEVLYHKLEVISSFPYSYPGSVSNIKIRKCVVTDQTSLFYEFKNNKIIILSIFDNRQSPDKIKL